MRTTRQRLSDGPGAAAAGRGPRGRGPLGGDSVRAVETIDWGLVDYAEALERQLAVHDERIRGQAPDRLILVSHPPTFTLGRRAPEDDIVLDHAELERRGIVVARSDRGGRATYHGPGQVVLYPIVSIAGLGLGVKDWVCLLESALIDTLADYGVLGRRRAGTAGIWTVETAACPAPTDRPVGPSTPGEGAKIASLGLRVSRGVSYHGVALNTGLDASVFDCIVTCGVRGERVTTLEAETGRRPDDGQVGRRLAGHIEARMTRTATGSSDGPSSAGSCAAPEPEVHRVPDNDSPEPSEN